MPLESDFCRRVFFERREKALWKKSAACLKSCGVVYGRRVKALRV
jgi:hypothetical protein